MSYDSMSIEELKKKLEQLQKSKESSKKKTRQPVTIVNISK